LRIPRSASPGMWTAVPADTGFSTLLEEDGAASSDRLTHRLPCRSRPAGNKASRPATTPGRA